MQFGSWYILCRYTVLANWAIFFLNHNWNNNNNIKNALCFTCHSSVVDKFPHHYDPESEIPILGLVSEIRL